MTALAYVSVRRLSQTEHPLVIIIYFPMISVPLTLPWVLNQGVWPEGIEWFWLLGVGVMTQLGQIWVTEGLRCLPAAHLPGIDRFCEPQPAPACGKDHLHVVDRCGSGGGMLVLAATLISLSARR